MSNKIIVRSFGKSVPMRVAIPRRVLKKIITMGLQRYVNIDTQEQWTGLT